MQNSEIQYFTGTHSVLTVGELVRADIDAFVTEFRRTNGLLRQTKQGELSPETLGRYLRSLHYLISHTPIHLAIAEDRARSLGYARLAAHFAHKRKEEEGHDAWAEADIERLAKRFGIAVPDDPTPEMLAIVDANTELVHREPHSYLVYMLFAEYVTVTLGPEWLAALADKCGIAASFVTVIGMHVELDRDHVVEGIREIDALVHESRSVFVRAALQGMMRRFAAFCDGLCTSSS